MELLVLFILLLIYLCIIISLFFCFVYFLFIYLCIVISLFFVFVCYIIYYGFCIMALLVLLNYHFVFIMKPQFQSWAKSQVLVILKPLKHLAVHLGGKSLGVMSFFGGVSLTFIRHCCVDVEKASPPPGWRLFSECGFSPTWRYTLKSGAAHELAESSHHHHSRPRILHSEPSSLQCYQTTKCIKINTKHCWYF